MQRVMWHDAFCITPLKMSPPGARIDLARYGAWPAETTHTPRVPDMAVAAHRRARIIKQIFSVVAIAARARRNQPYPGAGVKLRLHVILTSPPCPSLS